MKPYFSSVQVDLPHYIVQAAPATIGSQAG
jgi:hypothetical protein